MVVGFHLSMDKPARVSLGLCMLNVVYDKSAWLKEREIDASWPAAGLPETVHSDNGAVFGEPLLVGHLRAVIRTMSTSSAPLETEQQPVIAVPGRIDRLLQAQSGQHCARGRGLPRRNRHRASAEGAHFRIAGSALRWQSSIEGAGVQPKRAVLAPALERFSPTPEMPEIAEAHALLAAVAATA
jgi:hypothetical protein